MCPRCSALGAKNGSASTVRAVSLFKTCVTCETQKPATDFLPSKFTADGKTDRCKACVFAASEAERQKRETRKAESKRANVAGGKIAKKHCRTCRTTKPIGEFRRHAHSHDGHVHSCRSCQEVARARRKVAIELTPEQIAEKHKKKLASNRRAVSRWQQENTEAVRAKAAVASALKRGVIAKPIRCQVRACKNSGRLHAHHSDYSAPLTVAWLCPAHHKALHHGRGLELVPGLPASLAAAPRR